MITGITGIDDELVAGAPPIHEALPRFVAFAQDSVLVAHNAQFDLSFLDYELGRLQRRTFPRPALDTLRLARKLCPPTALLAGRAQLPLRHPRQARAPRAAGRTGHRRAAAAVPGPPAGAGPHHPRGGGALLRAGGARNYHKISLTEGLPNTPGVYVMRDAKGQALYIGKAENLKRRTRDHFLQRQAHHARQALELLERFEVTATGSEFAALLLEQRLIARHKPPYNTQGTRAASYHYVKLSAEPYPRLYATPNLRDDGSYYAGPFRKAALARRFVDCVNGAYPLRTCARTCPARGTPARGRASGRTWAPAWRPAAARSTASTPRWSTPCGTCCRATARAWTSACASVRRRSCRRSPSSRRAVCRRNARRCSARCAACAACRRRADHEVVLVYPARRAGWVALWAVRGGAVVVEREVGRAAFDAQAAAGFLADTAAATPPRPPLPALLIDEMLLLHGWIEQHREAVNVLALQGLAEGDDERRTALAAELLARVHLCAAPAPEQQGEPA